MLSAGAADLAFAAGEDQGDGEELHPNVEYSIREGCETTFSSCCVFVKATKSLLEAGATTRKHTFTTPTVWFACCIRPARVSFEKSGALIFATEVFP